MKKLDYEGFEKHRKKISPDSFKPYKNRLIHGIRILKESKEYQNYLDEEKILEDFLHKKELNAKYLKERFNEKSSDYPSYTSLYASVTSAFKKYKEYISGEWIYKTNKRGDKMVTYEINKPLNQILYGPPGTGKTYHTINKALEIIEGKFSLEEEFKEWWFSDNFLKNSKEPYSKNTKEFYFRALQLLNLENKEYMKEKIDCFSITDIDELKKLIIRLEKGDLKEYNRRHGNTDTSNGLEKYIRFLQERKITKRKELKNRFKEYKEKGQIEFITFHQSYGYEEFVEGIKASTNEKDEITYKVADGIFKKICKESTKAGTPGRSFSFLSPPLNFA